MGNSILNKAKYSKSNTDEWYTTYETVEKELSNYMPQFKNKIVLCNCDDPYESSFSKYFLNNFNKLELKKLICISYGKSKMHLSDCDRGLVLEIDRLPDSLYGEEIELYIKENNFVKKLLGDGDFRSEESIKYLIESDIVVTNPPFSKFIELFSLISQYNKKYLLISNQNAITYKEIFPYIKMNQAKIGYHFGDMQFKVPADTEPRKTRFWIDESGQKWRSIGNAMWLTNLDINKNINQLILKHKYVEGKYPKYDNFDAIHISKVSEIPYDYDGVMGVPITFLKYYDEKSYEIIGEANHGSDNEFDLFKPVINGKETFKRILIRKRKRESYEI